MSAIEGEDRILNSHVLSKIPIKPYLKIKKQPRQTVLIKPLTVAPVKIVVAIEAVALAEIVVVIEAKTQTEVEVETEAFPEVVITPTVEVDHADVVETMALDNQIFKTRVFTNGTK